MNKSLVFVKALVFTFSMFFIEMGVTFSQNEAQNNMIKESTVKWTKENDTWKLTNGEELILSLGKKENKCLPIWMENRSFQLKEKGSWNTTWILETERKEKILQMKFGFWSSKARIIFADSAQYIGRFKNMPNLQFIIHDLRYKEDLISFQLDKQKNGEIQPKMILHQKEMFTDKLLFLVALGMSVFLQHHQDDVDITTFLLLTSA